MDKKVLIIGAGGREHALARAFAKSDQVAQVFVAPGNPGMMIDSDKIQCLDQISINDIEALKDFAESQAIAVTFVGSEEPLSNGIVDEFKQADLPIVGPTQAAAQLETSKHFAKQVMRRAQVPTSAYEMFNADQYEAAKAYIATQTAPIVIKQNGLAAGKGVIIAQTLEEAEEALSQLMVALKADVIIEEFMTGPEYSLFSLINGESIIHIGVAQDYKRAQDNDEGLNTGGMGAYSPVAFVDDALLTETIETVVRPLASQMCADGVPYTGILYTGLMLTKNGPRVIEFNCRFGDPETQILLPLIKSDFYDLVTAHLQGQDFAVELADSVSLGVIVAAEGYPQTYPKGMPIKLSANIPVSQIYFAGTKLDEQDQLVANGGRILMVVSQQASIAACREDVYGLLAQLSIPKTYYRKDIGL